MVGFREKEKLIIRLEGTFCGAQGANEVSYAVSSQSFVLHEILKPILKS